MAAPKIDPEKTYRVYLKRVVEISPTIFMRPYDDVVLKGKVLSAILDAVERYEEA